MSNEYLRTFVLDDIQISRSHRDGRTVEAYAAVFDIPVEVQDQHGHYTEVIDRSAFNRTLKNNLDKVIVLYNHGRNLDGSPSDFGSVPIGRPLEIRADQKGLFTVTRYNKSEFADSVLEAIRNDAIRTQSFSGRIYRSNPAGRVPRVRAGQPLPVVTRLELGLREYGPTPIPVYEQAAVTAVRSVQDIVGDIANLDDNSIAELVRTLSVTSARNSATGSATPGNAGLGTEDSLNQHSARQRLLRLRTDMRYRGVLGNGS